MGLQVLPPVRQELLLHRRRRQGRWREHALHAAAKAGRGREGQGELEAHGVMVQFWAHCGIQDFSSIKFPLVRPYKSESTTNTRRGNVSRIAGLMFLEVATLDGESYCPGIFLFGKIT